MTVDVETFRVGAVECSRFVHGRGRGDPAWMFPDTPGPLLRREMGGYLDGAGRFEFVYSSLMLRSGSDLVLLDTSLPAPSSFETSSIDRALAGVGVAPSEISAVVITHAHLDHVGGLVRSGSPVFGGARHLTSVDEIEFWVGERSNSDEASVLRTVSRRGLVDTVDGEHELLPGVRVVPTPGHTPGHLAVEIRSEGETAIYVGDVLAHEVNVGEPDWNHFSDMDPAAAAATRRRLVEDAAAERAIVVGSHLTTVGRILPRPSGGFVHRSGVIPSRFT